MLRLISYIFIIGFLLNLIWEVVQAPLYVGYKSFSNNFLMCFVASIIDAIVVVFLFSIFVAAYKDINWIKNLSLGNAVILIILGGLIAIGFEQWALTNGAWNYTDKMPIVFSSIGLFPLLQLMFLPLISFFIARKLWL